MITNHVNEIPTVHGLADDNNKKLYTKTMTLWNNHYNLMFNVITVSEMKMRNMNIMHRKYLALEQYHYNYNTVTTITLSLQ